MPSQTKPIHKTRPAPPTTPAQKLAASKGKKPNKSHQKNKKQVVRRVYCSDSENEDESETKTDAKTNGNSANAKEMGRDNIKTSAANIAKAEKTHERESDEIAKTEAIPTSVKTGANAIATEETTPKFSMTLKKSAPKKTKRARDKEEEAQIESEDDSEGEVDSDLESHDADEESDEARLAGEAVRLEKQRLKKQKFADAIQNLLTNEPKYDKREEAVAEIQKDTLNAKKRKEVTVQRKEKKEKQHILPSLETHEKERALRRLATKGVVQVFNMLKDAQKASASSA